MYTNKKWLIIIVKCIGYLQSKSKKDFHQTQIETRVISYLYTTCIYIYCSHEK